MKQFPIFLILSFTFIRCAQQENVDYVLAKYYQQVDTIQKIEYRVNRIDTFFSGSVWNNQGYAFLERNETDSIFGFSFYGKRDDVQEAHFYDEGLGFDITEAAKSFKKTKTGKHFLGKPGGQMIVPDLFQLHDNYKSVVLTTTPERYVITYTFEDDTVHDITNQMKLVELDQKSFLPIKWIEYSTKLGNPAVRQMVLSDIKINDQVENSVTTYNDMIRDYSLVTPAAPAPSKLLDKVFPAISLPNLQDSSEVIKLPTGQLTLIDFWEVWCAPCVRSMPKVEQLQHKYADKLQVLGIVTENETNAKKLVKKKGITFVNLKGSKAVRETLNITSYPTYMLIDEDGITQSVYYGFDREKIEADIQRLLP
ncbi:TlpA disulfide reductase family protein [Fulvivirgaceae bacterium BMA12]|uniref:TlpA disulfide reductase family protein n=1 Tax=Agaribacillus aureus TaxID=3051825 RepID=A0ABT8L6P1_9BACT|nr:TlpA disulfide reductase family protein [Fulvivirgaceae bacterium BMA12]